VLSTELNEVYELRLAALEADLLSRNDLVQRGAYFLAVDGQPTNHFRICTGGGVELPKTSGVRLQSFLGTHRFKSSYATHGLFPYRGKFHPQMIKAIINIMGVRPGDTLLDPMAGSGTTGVEASLMGIDSVSVDVSPFCVFMMKAKLAGLSEEIAPLERVVASGRETKRFFSELSSEAGMRKIRDQSYEPKNLSRGCLDLLALAYMDSRGFSERSSRNSHEGFFAEVLTKYVRTIRQFQNVTTRLRLQVGAGKVLEGDARALEMPEDSVDGVVFSPPYSFAIDYVENDGPHLEYLGASQQDLRSKLVGLRGRGERGRAEAYFEDMTSVLRETARVLRAGKYCTIIVGSNSNQLARALKLDPKSPEARYGIESRLVDIAEDNGLFLELAIRRLIVGMANTMREEHILFLRKGS
jgi:16S rRNA G966 N2-methylase RsmD